LAVLALLAPLVLACAAGCDAPLGAFRRSPPSGIDARVLAARATAPAFALDGTLNGATVSFRLSDALSRDNVLLVFYRGHW
jgi:hypothetical protein